MVKITALHRSTCASRTRRVGWRPKFSMLAHVEHVEHMFLPNLPRIFSVGCGHLGRLLFSVFLAS
jgi:hypothetical protein